MPYWEQLRLISGVLILAFGLYYRVKDKADAESVKIYTIISAIGGVVAVVCALLLLL